MKVTIHSEKEQTFFVKHANFKRRDVTVFLEKEGTPTGFYCPYCKNWIMNHQANLVELVPGDPPQELRHITVRCSNERCNTFYHFVSAV